MNNLTKDEIKRIFLEYWNVVEIKPDDDQVKYYFEYGQIKHTDFIYEIFTVKKFIFNYYESFIHVLNKKSKKMKHVTPYKTEAYKKDACIKAAKQVLKTFSEKINKKY